VSILLGWFNAWSEHSPQVCKVKRCGIGTIVGVAIKMKDLLALNREETGKNAFL
jgi:hypothetical protein